MKQELERKEKENIANDKVRFFSYGFKIDSLVGEHYPLLLCSSWSHRGGGDSNG